jgi:hypothetical protein
MVEEGDCRSKNTTLIDIEHLTNLRKPPYYICCRVLSGSSSKKIDCELAKQSCTYRHRSGLLLVNATIFSFEKLSKIHGRVWPVL